MFATLANVRAARFPIAGLAALAPVRSQGAIRVIEFADEAWVFWDRDEATILQLLIGIPGVEFYVKGRAGWMRIESKLPRFDVPPLDAANDLQLTILPDAAEPTRVSESTFQRIAVSLVRCEKQRPTTALCCEVSALRDWADTALTSEITRVRAIRSGNRAWLLGNDLPALPAAERFWGKRLLAPLGYRPEPDWPEPILLEVAGIEKKELLVMHLDRAETLPMEAFQPLTRAAIRLALNR
jgi:hypothetical protein